MSAPAAHALQEQRLHRETHGLAPVVTATKRKPGRRPAKSKPPADKPSTSPGTARKREVRERLNRIADAAEAYLAANGPTPRAVVVAAIDGASTRHLMRLAEEGLLAERREPPSQECPAGRVVVKLPGLSEPAPV